MSTITINFQNAVVTMTTLQILISHGSFGLDASNDLSISGTISFSSLYITTGGINFNVDSGTSFTGSVVVPVSATGGAPVLEVANFAGAVTVTWPTANGLETEAVMSGDPITLAGFVS